MNIKLFLKNLVAKLCGKLKIKNVIVFESTPDYSDNTKAVFDEMLKRGLNKKYKFIWVCQSKEKAAELDTSFKKYGNVRFLHQGDLLCKLYYLNVACAFIICNRFLPRSKKEQYYCDLAHGCALKNAAGKYSVPFWCQDVDVMTISDYLAPYDAHNLSCSPSCMRPLGYARNDDLFNTSDVDIHKYFSDVTFSKMIYWLPTYRQHESGSASHSDIAMPVIYNEEIARKINACAKENDVIIIVKVHPAQDLSVIEAFDLSHLKFVKNDFFDGKPFNNYQLLGSSDAMISDYSSVYYDYLLCDKPIGLCWDDFEEYNKREGFTLDPHVILAGGEKIYNADDLCAFIVRIKEGKDELGEKRNEIKNLVHDHIDNQSTKRIVDYLESKIIKK